MISQNRPSDIGVGVGVGAVSPDYILQYYEEKLSPVGSPKDKLRIPKSILPELPSRFERTLKADPPDGAKESYRDNTRARFSTHVNEFPDYWQIHIDYFNPEYRPFEHVVLDAPEQSAEFLKAAIYAIDLFSS